MRADTHDGPEQMLHVRGLIHCCSSHVRRSWNSVLQRTAGSYIMAHLGRADARWKCPLTGGKRTPFGAKADEEAERNAVQPGQRSQIHPSPPQLPLLIKSST